MLSLAVTSLPTGVTEPIEFLFIILAPALFGIRALLTGAAMMLLAILMVKLGFGFSAGLINYVLTFRLATVHHAAATGDQGPRAGGRGGAALVRRARDHPAVHRRTPGRAGRNRGPGGR